jgi:tRNA (guanine-N1)-methyltransferase
MELFFSPTGNPREFYQFFVAYGEQTDSLFYDEGGQIQPDPYAPQWKRAVYAGEDYWSCEVEIPLSAFYMTRNDCWSDTWLVNMGRTRWCRDGWVYSTWMPTENGFIEPERFGAVDGMPMRQLADDVLISSAFVDLTEQNQDGYRGTMTVQVKLAVGGTFTFTSPDAQSITLELPVGNSQIVTPCFFAKLGRPKVELSLKRESSGEVYGRKYPVLVQYEPIKLQFTLPEYRNNFYPGQDYTKITGKAFSQKTAHRYAEETNHLVLLCGHYEGMDERIFRHVDEEISLGDYILTGGEIPAMAVADAVIRLLPGSLREESTGEESFENGLLEYPQYTQPAVYEGEAVPEVLLSGNHEKIRQWRLRESLRRTMARRPDLLEGRVLTEEEACILRELREENGATAPGEEQ